MPKKSAPLVTTRAMTILGHKFPAGTASSTIMQQTGCKASHIADLQRAGWMIEREHYDAEPVTAPPEGSTFCAYREPAEAGWAVLRRRRRPGRRVQAADGRVRSA